MLATSKKMINPKTIANRRLPIPKEGDFGPSGPVVFDSAVIRDASTSVQVLAVGPPIMMILQFPYCHPHSIVSYTRRSVGSFRFYDRSVAGSEPEFTWEL